MTDTPKCEPPPEWRDRDGWHICTASRGSQVYVRWSPTYQAWAFDRTTHTPEQLAANGWRYVAPVTPPAEAEALRKDAQDGWIFHNPDTGMEWADNHPIESGEVPDATCVQAATAPRLASLLKQSWGEAFNLRARVAELEDALSTLHEAAEMLLGGTGRIWGRGPEDADHYTHEPRHAEYLAEAEKTARSALERKP